MAGALSRDDLAERAGVARGRIDAYVHHGVVTPGSDAGSFAAADVRRVRLAAACEDAGLSAELLGAAVASGRLSFAFLDESPYGVLADYTGQTFGELARQRQVPFELLAAMREALGFAKPEHGDPVREDDLPVVSLLGVGLEFGLDETTLVRLLRVYGDSLNRISEAEGAVYRRHIEEPFRDGGETPARVMALASEQAGRFVPLLEEVLVAIYHRQHEHTWTQNLIEGIEAAIDTHDGYRPVDRPAAMCFLDLTGYTRLTEQHGDEAAAGLAATLGDIIQPPVVAHGGRPVKWLGDGVMSHFPHPSQAVPAALEMVEAVQRNGLPPAHVGIASGPVVYQDGDYFGTTVNLAARIAAIASPGEVVVSAPTVDAGVPESIAFDEVAAVELKGFARPMALFRARQLGTRPDRPAPG